MKNIILIGGVPGTGKTTLAKQLSEHLTIPWISTDQIRTILDVKETDLNKEITEVWEGVVSLIKSPYPWEEVIIEGNAVLPDKVMQEFGVDTNINIVF